MAAVQGTVLDRIGRTPLVALRRIGVPNGGRILLKLEDENPTGSMKDRMALAMIEAAEADGRLKPGGAVVEYTGGSTGVSLALVCAVKGYPLHIVSSDAFARKARPYGDPRSEADDRAERIRAHDREADARHGRGGADHRGRNECLLDRSVEEYRPARGVSCDGRRNPA